MIDETSQETRKKNKNYKLKNNKAINFRNEPKSVFVDCAFCCFDAQIFLMTAWRMVWEP